MLQPLSIPRISPPSPQDFFENYVKGSKPVIISGLSDGWPAQRDWSLEYLIQNYGDTLSSAYPIRDSQCDVMVNRGSPLNTITVRESLSSVLKGHLDGGYALASLIDKFPARIKADYSLPVYCADEDFLVSRLFIGPRALLSPLHQDLAENLYFIIRGKKRLTLFAPGDKVYPSRFSKLPNHAYVDPEKPDYAAYPDFARAQPYIVELVAGETLYIPSMWWHHLRNLDSSIALNFWWYRGWKYYFARASALYRKIKPN